MSEGKRPGGLTALAVLNFVFSGINLLGCLGMVAMMAFIHLAAEAGGSDDEGQRQAIEAWKQLGVGLFYGLLAMMAATALLLLLSGIGYLQQKKFLGRALGNLNAALSIGSSLVWGLAVQSDELGGGFNIGTILGLVYPLLTLVLLNTTFKEDFVR